MDIKYCTLKRFYHLYKNYFVIDTKSLKYINEFKDLDRPGRVSAYTWKSTIVCYISKRNKLIGFACLKLFYDNDIEIMYISIHKDYRRQGLGTKIIESIKRRTCGIYLTSATKALLRFYKKLGFRNTGMYRMNWFIKGKENDWFRRFLLKNNKGEDNGLNSKR